nr:DUF4347 domain-containing protein [Methylomarinum sp. Ch1-1]MDP4519661.1 DUF4347 domain-containing protein [Methylomarinum sp. Ch1-1]
MTDAAIIEPVILQEVDNVIIDSDGNTADVVESVTALPRELVFIDADVENYQQLLNDIVGQDGVERNLEVILLDNQRNGIEQISEALASYSELDAVHLISHGDDGTVDIGNSRLDLQALNQNLAEIAAWGEAFSTDGDFLIYGCNLAQTEAGKSLLNDLSQLTDTDVAASEDLTGHASLGGDWELEFSTGQIDTDIAVSASGQQDWQALLATYPSSYGLLSPLEWITNVSFAGIDNASGPEGLLSIGAYGDYTDQFANVEVGKTYTLSVTIQPNTLLANEFVNAWIDWNQDGDFTDAGEAYSVAAGVNTSGPHSIDITAPDTALSGATRLRVSLNNGGSPASDGIDLLGEVEDYSVTINNAPQAADSTVTTDEDTTYVFNAADFNFSDIDGDSLASVQITSLETAGSLQLSGVDVALNQVIGLADIDAANLTYMPAADANGSAYASFGFTVNDGIANSIASYTMTIDVSAVNDAPTGAVTIGGVAEENQTLTAANTSATPTASAARSATNGYATALRSPARRRAAIRWATPTSVHRSACRPAISTTRAAPKRSSPTPPPSSATSTTPRPAA